MVVGLWRWNNTLEEQEMLISEGLSEQEMHSVGNMDDEGLHHTDMMRQMLVESEKEFIEKMIPHHQEAISTAGEVLARGGMTEDIRNLMERIIEAQTQEVESMRTWYEDWYGTVYQDNGEYKPMMRDLEELNGREIDQAFLEDMIVHHMGAIMMARSIQPFIEHEEMETLSANVIQTQSAEIVEMREMLGVEVEEEI